MTLVAKCIALSLVIAFFFIVGWLGYLANRLWSTSEYGGKIYNRTILKALSSVFLLWFANFIADAVDITKETRTVGVYLALPFFLVGWLLHRRKELSGPKRPE